MQERSGVNAEITHLPIRSQHGGKLCRIAIVFPIGNAIAPGNAVSHAGHPHRRSQNTCNQAKENQTIQKHRLEYLRKFSIHANAMLFDISHFIFMHTTGAGHFRDFLPAPRIRKLFSSPPIRPVTGNASLNSFQSANIKKCLLDLKTISGDVRFEKHLCEGNNSETS